MTVPALPGDGPLLVLAPDVSLVGEARAFVSRVCRSLGVDPDTCDTAVLLSSELVTNAFIHGRSEARVSVHVEDGRVLVRVADDNSRHPRPEADDPDALDGRGMSIVDMLATRWGVLDDPYGKTVWFEISPSGR
jgi:anti-sigma regulatory factor (Ser/Thr protein kinase)